MKKYFFITICITACGEMEVNMNDILFLSIGEFYKRLKIDVLEVVINKGI
ncbi:MAG: hypothetical protein PHY90_04125 [Desulfitobacteriaceae bacterium]|nr:hypothetical protein [Desulfitobacteriaceae bacterium]